MLFFIYFLTGFTNFVAVIIVILATQLRASAGYAGASMLGVINLTMNLSSACISYVEVQSALMAVKRVKDFTEKSPCESLDGEDLAPDDKWPQKGRLQIQNLSASYGYV